MSTLPPAPNAYVPVAVPRQTVVVTDIDMSIGRMCIFMVKWVIAAIPAFFILWLLFLVVGVILALIAGTFFHGIGGMSPWHY